MILKVNNLVVHYGKAIALHGVSMNVSEGSVVSLLGANGAGKTTLLRTISGLIPATSGEIWFQNKKINKHAGQRSEKSRHQVDPVCRGAYGDLRKKMGQQAPCRRSGRMRNAQR